MFVRFVLVTGMWSFFAGISVLKPFQLLQI